MLCAVLPTPLQALHLRSNGIGPAGVQALAAALAPGGNATLQKLVLERNAGIGDVGASALAGVVATHPTLISLDLVRTSVGPAGAQALAAALKKSKVLQARTCACLWPLTAIRFWLPNL